MRPHARTLATPAFGRLAYRPHHWLLVGIPLAIAATRDPDHYVRRLISGLLVGLGVYVLFWPTVVLLVILAVSFGY